MKAASEEPWVPGNELVAQQMLLCYSPQQFTMLAKDKGNYSPLTLFVPRIVFRYFLKLQNLKNPEGMYLRRWL